MLVTVTALLLAAAGAAHAQSGAPACQTYTRASRPVPDMVRDWLARSADDRVQVCALPAPGSGRAQTAIAPQIAAQSAPLYTGEGVLTRDGAVCRYTTHVLVPVGSGPKRQLRRYERTDSQAMALAGRECPPAHPPGGTGGYTATYDVTPAAFVSIMELWSAAAGSAGRWRHGGCCEENAPAGAAATGGSAADSVGARRLRAAIETGRMRGAAVTRIVQLTPGVRLRRRYALFVADPQSEPPGSRLYVVYFSHRLAGTWQITGAADALD